MFKSAILRTATSLLRQATTLATPSNVAVRQLNVLALVGSSKKKNGMTQALLTPFLQGITDADPSANVERLNVSDYRVRNCKGCLACWLRTPGQCAQKDDMTKTILPKMKQADVIVLATPVYVDGMSGQLKTVLDRIIPAVKPFVELRDGHIRHQFPKSTKHGPDTKMVVLSTSGFPEMDNFEALITHVRNASRHLDRKFVRPIVRPSAMAVQAMGQFDKVAQSVRLAGQEMVRDGDVSEATANQISRPFFPVGAYPGIINKKFEQLCKQNSCVWED